MWDNMIGRHIRRSTRNLLIWNAIILIGIIGFFVISNRYWYNFFLGPFPLDKETLVNLKDDSGMQNLVTVQGDLCFDTGSRYITTDKRGRQNVRAKYLGMFVGDKLLIVKADLDAPAQNLEWRGVLDDAPNDVQQKIVGDFNAALRLNRAPGAARLPPFLPVMLDATITRTKGYIALIVLIPLATLSILNIFKAMSRFGNPQQHPLAKKLLKYGEPEEVAQKIEDEYGSQDQQVVGPVTFTRSWAIRPTTFGVDAVFLGDSAWTYKSMTQHYHNGVPTGKTYAAHLCDIHGAQLSVTLKNEALTDEFVIAVRERVPWVLAGFDPELERLWKKDKAQLFSIVEERRTNLAEEIRRQREASDVEEVEPVRGEDEGPLDVEPA